MITTDARDRATSGQARPGSIEQLIEGMNIGLEVLHPGGLEVTREMADLAGIGEGSQVLDVASGTGETACFLAETYRCHVEGVDLSPDIVGRATRKARRRGVDAQFIEGNASELPFEDGRFDVVMSECTVCFLDKERVLAEMTRVAKPGGRVAIHDLAWKDGAPDEIKAKLAELENERPETIEGWKRVFEAVGLEDVQTVDRSDLIPGWMRESRKQMGLSGQAKVFWKVLTKMGPRGLLDLFRSERIFGSPHLGYAIIVGRKVG